MVAEERNGMNQIRKLLLDFYSAELHSHSRLIIGFSVMFFALWQLFLALFTPSVYTPITWWQYCVVFFSMGLVSTALWYLLIRYSVYGIFCGSVLSVNLAQNTALGEAFVATRNLVLTKNRVFEIVPPCLFIPCNVRITRLQKTFGVKGVLVLGAILCAVLGAFTTVLFAVLAGLWRI